MLATRCATILHSGHDALARATINALADNKPDDAVSLGFIFAAQAGGKYPEAFALCALALEKQGNLESALGHWDKALLNLPWRLDWLENALRLAWRAEKTCPIADKFATKWQGLLENIYVKVPSVDILAAMSRRGWTGKGCAGTNLGRIKGWLWLPKEEQIKLEVSGKVSNPLKFKFVPRGEAEGRILREMDCELPQAEQQFFVRMAGESGNDVNGFPVTCCPYASARTLPTSGRRKPEFHGITILIPFYADLFTAMRCIGSVFASLKHNSTPVRIMGIWDHGPDIRLLEALRKIASRKKFTLISTPHNLGFLGCVNHGLGQIHNGDVILLNSDTLVHGDWIDRMAEAGKTKDAATVTSLGSNAELMSFPSAFQRAQIRTFQQTAIIDEACKTIPPAKALIKIPVGVGFCMLVTRRAINAIGGLDGFRVYKGYGEEVDYCLRARDANLRNYGAVNVFVAHMGGKSFGSAKKALASQNNKAIYTLYPNYKKLYDNFLGSNPMQDVLEQISILAAPKLLNVEIVEIYPHSYRYLPLWWEKENAPRTRAAMFIRRNGENFFAILRINGEVPLAEMSFRLPDESTKLGALLKTIKIESALVRAGYESCLKAANMLDLPVHHGEEGNVPLLPKVLDTGSYLIIPPLKISGWKRLCEVARNNPASMFYVLRLQQIWGTAPRPANIIFLPDCNDLRPLGALALLMCPEEHEPGIWREWLTERFCADLPVFSLEKQNDI